MSFFKRNKNAPLIPPVTPAPGSMSEPKSDPYAPGQPSNGFSSDPYAKSKPSNVNGGDPYARSNTEKPGDNPYAKRSTQIDATRDELFSGYKAPDKPAAERKFGYEGRETEEDFDEDEEVEGIRQEMRGLKQDSLASTRWVWAGRRGEWMGRVGVERAEGGRVV